MGLQEERVADLYVMQQRSSCSLGSCQCIRSTDAVDSPLGGAFQGGCETIRQGICRNNHLQLSAYITVTSLQWPLFSPEIWRSRIKRCTVRRRGRTQLSHTTVLKPQTQDEPSEALAFSSPAPFPATPR